MDIATAEIKAFLASHDMDVRLVLFDQEALAVGQDRMGPVKAYIDAHYVAQAKDMDRRQGSLTRSLLLEELSEAFIFEAPSRLDVKPASLGDITDQLEAPFASYLLGLIDQKGMTDVEVYKRANLDRKLFSKIKNVKDYRPGKRTVVALAIGLQLDLDEADAFLRRAGYAFSQADLADVIVEYFIITGQYDIFAINEALFAHDQALLGS